MLFNTPAIQETAHGLVDGTVYYVKVIDSDTIELYTNTALTNKVTVTTTESPKGLSRLGLCYKVESASGNSRRTAFNSNFSGGSMQFISASRYNVRGAGTPTNPFSGESTNLGLHGTTASATFRVLTAGTVF